MGNILIDTDEELICDMKKRSEGNIQNEALRNRNKNKWKKEHNTYYILKRPNFGFQYQKKREKEWIQYLKR